MVDINKNNKLLMELKLTSENLATTIQLPTNTTNLDEFSDLACAIDKYQFNPLHNVSVKKDDGEGNYGNNMIELYK